MAEQQNTPGTNNTVTGGMYKDTGTLYNKADNWNHARNATNYLPDGQAGYLHSEPGNILCVTFPYPLIGSIFLAGDQWVVFLTDDTTWEIGYFYDDECRYESITGPQTCPIFNRKYPVIGASKRGYDCGFNIYWSTGGYSYDGFLNTAKVPFVQIDTTPTGPCRTYIDTTVIDCEKLRLCPHFNIPCLKLAKGEGSGQLPNGTYQVAIRYVINGFPCTDFIALSPLESVWDHNNMASAVRLSITGAETNIFSDMEVVLVSRVNGQITARAIGIYSTHQSVIYIDDIDQTAPFVPLEQLPINTPEIESSDGIYSVSLYLTRVGPRTKPEPNYQPQANNIRAFWQCTEYNDQYYRRGGDSVGMNVGYMRDEVYAYYIRWVWKSGQKTVSYSIPGRPAGTPPTLLFGGISTGDSGTPIAYGRMAGYSSTELYPDAQPNVWGPLCGLNIRHHKFPDQALHPALTHFTNGNTIRVMGVWFDNITLPLDNAGNVLEDIQGYEILRAVRDGHESVIAKGQVNHMRGYRKIDGTTGLYQNYPYDDLHADRYLTTSQTIGTVGGTVDGWQGNEQNIISQDVVSFHSPDTSFQHPNLGGGGSLVLYQAHAGIAEGTFDIPYQHPKFKLLTDLSSILATGIGSLVTQLNLLNSLTGSSMSLAANEDVPMHNPLGFGTIPEGPLGSLATVVYAAATAITATINLVMSPITTITVSQQVLNIVNGLLPPIQYARQYNSHGFYDEPVYSPKSTFAVSDYQYVGGQLQTFGIYDINNLYRNNYLALNIGATLPGFQAPYNINPVGGGTQNYATAIQFIGDTATTGVLNPTVDCSRFTLGQAPSSPNPPGPRAILGPFKSPIVSWYGAYKVSQPSQYGQVDSPKQVPISCVERVDPTFTGTYTTPVLFGGDTYINRYTEKNPFMYFNDWLFGQLPDYQYDYTQYENVPYPRYWINNSKIYYDFWELGLGRGASKNWHLDELASTASVPWPPLPGVNSKFYVESGYFYLFNNGVRDFYVESSVNVGYRDWEDDHSKRFYDPYRYTTLDYMFRSDIIKSDILYKYDYSLSADRFWNQYLSWGMMFSRNYDPNLEYTCFTYYPRRIAYSLSQDEEDKRDNWRMFLPNNYKDMPAKATAIKEISNTGALIMLEDRSPVALLGVQSIPSSSGTDYSVGNGSLFDQALSAVSNSDSSLQYGSCQNRLSVINTPHGVFWVSRDTGKVFQYTGDLKDITPGLKWHLSLYMPSTLLVQYPNYPYTDSPLIGIGIQCVYDSVNEMLYICRKDYRAKDYALTFYNSTLDKWQYMYDTGSESVPIDIELGDSEYFEDCSWTLSWDCRKGQWVSWHDWTPAFNIPSKRHFLTSNSIKDAGASVWRHNSRTDLYVNYYGIDYPWEIDYTIGTGTSTTTLQSIQYILDSYSYTPNQTDKFQQYLHVPDFATVYNEEQSTGPLLLIPKPFNDPYATLNYPDYSLAAGVQVIQDKVEGKMRFSMGLVDYTDNRFQFTPGTMQYWVTAGNGYVRSANPGYISWLKPYDQLKKIRAKNSNVLLRKSIVGTKSLSFLTASTKNIISNR